LSGALKSILPIGGAILGSTFGPGGALLGGALGGLAGGTGKVSAAQMGAPPSTMDLARSGGFSGRMGTDFYEMTADGTLARRDMSFPKGQIEVDAAMQRNIGDIGGLRGGIASLREQVQPGFGRLTESRVQAVRNAGAESIGNLRESLARRGVMGSSFANDAETRVRMATSQEEQAARNEAFVSEMAMSLGLAQEDRAILGQQTAAINQRATQIAGIMDRELNELGIVGSIRNGLNAAITQQASQMAALQALQMQTNAQLQTQANLGNANNQAGFAGLGTLGAANMNLFGGSSGGTGSPQIMANPTFGRGSGGLFGSI
jgi:hypothetical protein